MATPLQGYLGSLQGNNVSLQGSSPSNLQGNATNLQGTPTVPTPAPKKVTYGNTAATSPKEKFISSIADNNPSALASANESYLKSNPNIFGGSTDTSTDNPSPAIAPPSALDTARTKYLESLSPDTSVSSAKQKYNDFVINEKLGENALEGQGRGIPLGLVRGQQSKLNQQSELEAARLQGDVSIAQGTQTANQNKAKAALDFATTDAEGSKPVSVAQGSNLVRLNPATGKYETVASGDPKPETLPASAQEYEYAKKNGYKGTYEQYQTEDANRKRSITNISTGSGLTPGQVNTTVNQIAGAFDNEPIVREYNTVASTLAALKNAGTSPTDDIQRIYAFAKIADPSSAVKEGEYKTIQDYSTALFKRLGINVARAFNEQGFLTESARNSMSTTLNNILQAKKNSYDNVAKEYQRQIDDAYSGKPRQLTNYSTPNNSNGTAGGDPLGIR